MLSLFAGFTPVSITVDSKNIYWFNSTEKNVYYKNKLEMDKINQVEVSHGYKILALDPANQPYPPRECLIPKTTNIKARVLSNSANTITLEMPSIEKPHRCSNFVYEMALIEYTIFYGPQESKTGIPCDRETCLFIHTIDQQVTLNDLLPFTNYSVTIEATNYYAKLYGITPIKGSTLIFQTAAKGNNYKVLI